MTHAVRVRLAELDDAAAVAAVYAPYVEGSAISFETDPPSADEVARRIAATLPDHPWLVAEVDGAVVGYAYATGHRARAAYRWSVDTAVYLAADRQRRGLGRRLSVVLHEVLRLQGYRQAFAGIALPNPASVALHESLGYRRIATEHAVGFKRGRWHDVGWWQLALSDDDAPPTGVRRLDRFGPDELLAVLGSRPSALDAG